MKCAKNTKNNSTNSFHCIALTAHFICTISDTR